MKIKFKHYDTTVTIKQQRDDQDATEMADIFFRLMLAAGYQLYSMLDAYEHVVYEHEWARNGDEREEGR